MAAARDWPRSRVPGGIPPRVSVWRDACGHAVIAAVGRVDAPSPRPARHPPRRRGRAKRVRRHPQRAFIRSTVPPAPLSAPVAAALPLQRRKRQVSHRWQRQGLRVARLYAWLTGAGRDVLSLRNRLPPPHAHLISGAGWTFPGTPRPNRPAIPRLRPAGSPAVPLRRRGRHAAARKSGSARSAGL